MTSGEFNVAIGDSAGQVLTSGTHSIFIGTNARTSKATIVGGIAIGNGAIVANNNQCMIGGPGSGSIYVSLIWGGDVAPADADLVAEQGCLFWDFTNGAGKLKIKAKTANGTVVTGEVALA